MRHTILVLFEPLKSSSPPPPPPPPFPPLVVRADLDPIYYCELGKLCPIKDDGDATIESLTVDPKSGPQGTHVYMVLYTVR